MKVCHQPFTAQQAKEMTGHLALHAKANKMKLPTRVVQHICTLFTSDSNSAPK